MLIDFHQSTAVGCYHQQASGGRGRLTTHALSAYYCLCIRTKTHGTLESGARACNRVPNIQQMHRAACTKGSSRPQCLGLTRVSHQLAAAGCVHHNASDGHLVMLARV